MSPETTLTLQANEWILLVEDSESDVILLRIALPDSSAANQLRWVSNGEIAIKMLSELAEKHPAELPDSVLLDLNLPRVDGFSVLAFIRSQPALWNLAVLVYSSSQSEREKRRALDGGADGFFTKPADLAGYRALSGAIEEARERRSRRIHKVAENAVS